MLVYLVTFLSSCFFIKISENNRNSKKKFVNYICVIIGLLIPCILAGLRHYTIGTDVQVYLKPLYECAKSSDNFFSFLNRHVTTTRTVSDFEIGFSFLVYSLTHIFGNMQIVLFVIELIIVGTLYFGIKNIDKIEKCNVWLCMLVFYMMFYNMSLNIMRQYISISIVFLGISYLLCDAKNKNIKCLISIIVAVLFHNSALLGLIIFFLYYTIKNNNRIIRLSNLAIPINKIIGYILIIIGLIVIMNTSVIVNMLGSVGMDYYTRYVNGNVTFLASAITRIVPIICIYAITRKAFNQKIDNAEFYIVIFIYSIIILQFTTINVFAARIALSFSIFNVVTFPRLCNVLEKRSNNFIITIIMIVYLLLYWFYYYVYNGGSETIPYVFYWNRII